VATYVVSGARSTNSFTPAVVTGYPVTQPTTPVWQLNGFSAFFVDKLRSVQANITANLSASAAGVPVVQCQAHAQCPAFLHKFTGVTPDEVARLIQLVPNKTSPQDIIPTPLMKLCKNDFSAVICHLANNCFTSGHFPASVRTGLVTPLLKKPGLDVDDYKSYTPVTNLSTFSKILEKLALVRLKSHITSPNYCPCSQPTVNCTQRRLLSSESSTTC